MDGSVGKRKVRIASIMRSSSSVVKFFFLFWDSVVNKKPLQFRHVRLYASGLVKKLSVLEGCDLAWVFTLITPPTK